MGQKTSPIGFRLGITHKHQSEWFLDPRSGSMKKSYPPLILEDKFIREYIIQKFPHSAIAQILIFRTAAPSIKIEIHTDKAKKLFYGIDKVLFFKKMKKTILELKKSSNNESVNSSNEFKFLTPAQKKKKEELELYIYYLKHLQKDLQVELLKHKKRLSFKFAHSKNFLSLSPSNNEEKENFTEKEIFQSIPIIGLSIKQLDQSFQYAAIFTKFLVSQLERRENSVKTALKNSLEFIKNYNIDGIKIKVSGRLDGVDMAEQTYIKRGRIPLSTLSANIDYSYNIAKTMYGILGIKVWTYNKN